jgi:hypothetical protein
LAAAAPVVVFACDDPHAASASVATRIGTVRRTRESYAERERLSTIDERPFWQIVAFSLCGLAALIAFEIGLLFLIAKLVTGHAY